MLKWVVVKDTLDPLIDVARQLFLEYSEELGIDLCFQGFAEELANLPGKYAPPSGMLVLLFDQNTPIACGALRRIDEATCELKRIYVRPSHRSRGLGRKLTMELMQAGRHIGYSICRLDTLRSLTAAIQLYQSLGFVEIPPYSPKPDLDVAYFETSL